MAGLDSHDAVVQALVGQRPDPTVVVNGVVVTAMTNIGQVVVDQLRRTSGQEPAPCRCCRLAVADPGDPDGLCIDCGVECADAFDGDVDRTSGRIWHCGLCDTTVPSSHLQAHLIEHSR